jgi:hypothetical protein
VAAKRVPQTREEKNARNAEYMRLYRARRTPEEREQLLAYFREWHKRHVRTDDEAERIRANARKYYAEQREERVKKTAEWRDKNREYSRALAKVWARDNPEKKAEKDAHYYDRHRDRITAVETAKREAKRADPGKRILLLLANTKSRARKAGREFDDAIYVLADHPATQCPCCGTPFVYAGRHATRSPSLDRVNNALGYVPGNVRVICYRCNTLKSDASIEEVKAILAYMSS